MRRRREHLYRRIGSLEKRVEARVPPRRVGFCVGAFEEGDTGDAAVRVNGQQYPTIAAASEAHAGLTLFRRRIVRPTGEQ